MSKMIQLRNVPDDLHRKLKVRAAQANLTLSDYLLREAAAVAERPTIEEILERLRKRAPVSTAESAAEAVRAERDAR
jgi:plasmid stability protein